MLFETQKRSFVKSVTYRILGTLATILITFVLTKKLELAVAAGILDTVFKIILYFFHERLWAHIRYGQKNPKGSVLWMTGLSGAGKTTLAKKLYDELKKKNENVVWLDGDHVRKHFPQLGFSKDERNDHIKRIALTASLLEQQGNCVIVSLISPYLESRYFAREQCQSFHEIYLSANLQVCKTRDVKGLYKKAELGEILNMTGVQDIYEPPVHPELKLDTGSLSVDQSLSQLKTYLKKQKLAV